MFLPEEIPEEDLNWSYQWALIAGEHVSTIDKFRYRDLLSSGEIKKSQQLFSGSTSFLSVGPFDMPKGDTLVIQLAQILGEGLDGLLDNTKSMNKLKETNFQIPSQPPSPPLEIITMDKAVKLSWVPKDNNNPETYQDPNRLDEADQPFEGYRIYKSTKSKEGPWTLLAEYDIRGNSFGPNTGLKHEYIDSGLLNNIEYYYTVTSYSKPDTVFPWPSIETSKTQTAREVVPGPAPPDEVGDVAVVPNPYRGDISYQNYNPPWEKSPPARSWMEQDRRLQFINLPEHCVIKIYTQRGDFVKKIKHNDPARGYEDWNLTSYVNQAIASGLYFYTVKNIETGKVQVGKFVVIK
jgi:hypothetical protein